MTDEPSRNEPQPPPLPDWLTDPAPVIAVLALGWLVAVVLSFTVSTLETWRPIALAGLGLTVFGTSVFLWQRHAARRGSRGAQSGLH
jgi:hypothetical protein